MGIGKLAAAKIAKKLKNYMKHLNFTGIIKRKEKILKELQKVWAIQYSLTFTKWEGKMEELDFIKNERVKLQNIYLKEAKNIWTNFEGIEADKKHKKSYNEYRNKDYFLEGLQAKIEDILKDLEYYKENNQGD